MREEAIGEMSQYLKLQRQALGLQRTIFPTTQYTEFNAAFQSQSSQLAEEIEWSDISQDPRFVIGDKVGCSSQPSTVHAFILMCAFMCMCIYVCTYVCIREGVYALPSQALYVPPGSPYCVYKPMKHGRLNVGPSQSLQSLLDILEDLWTQAIYEVLEIKREDLKVGRPTEPPSTQLSTLGTNKIATVDNFLHFSEHVYWNTVSPPSPFPLPLLNLPSSLSLFILPSSSILPSPSPFQHHNVILLIADTITRSHAKELMNLLLKKIGFANAVLHQVVHTTCPRAPCSG